MKANESKRSQQAQHTQRDSNGRFEASSHGKSSGRGSNAEHEKRDSHGRFESDSQKGEKKR